MLFLAGAAIFFVWFYFHSNDTEVAPAPQQTQGVTAADQAAAAAADAAVAAEQATEAVAPVVPVLVATPSELLQRYNSNEVAADQYFAGHLIRVTAPVLAIDKDITDSVVLHFATGDSFNDFMATLDDSQKTEAAQLHRGQTVTVQCKHMKRIIGSPIGDSCTLE